MGREAEDWLVSAFWFGRVRLKRRFWALETGGPLSTPEIRAVE